MPGIDRAPGDATLVPDRASLATQPSVTRRISHRIAETNAHLTESLVALGPTRLFSTLLVVATLMALVGQTGPAAAAGPAGTFSIVGRDTLTGELGVAVHSRAFAVGSGVAWAQAGVGAIATQAASNESFGPHGLELLAAGGDRRGLQSAAILVVRSSDTFPEYRTRYVNLHVEDHPDPINELIRVYEMYETTDLVRAHLRFAEEYAAAGRPELEQLEQHRVGETLQRLLTNDDATAETLNALAWFTALGEIYLDEALVAARRAVKLDPENAGIIDTLAEVHFRRGESDQAVSAGRRALALEPDAVYYQERLERFKLGAAGPGSAQ